MKPFPTIILAFATTVTFAQSKPYKATHAQTEALKTQAEAAATALMKQDYKQMAYYTYPKIVKAMGGADKMEAKLKTMMGMMQSQGISFTSVSVGRINDIIKSKGDLYSFVQDVLQVSMNGSVVTSSSFLMAISHDKGVRWYFVDTKVLKDNHVKTLFPTYPTGLLLPESKNPMF